MILMSQVSHCRERVVMPTNLGKTLEKKLEYMFRTLEHHRRILFVRVHVPLVKTKKGWIRTEKQHFDYVLLCDGVTWCIDAKECSQKKFYFTKKIEHQTAAMRQAQALGHKAGFIIWFKSAGYGDECLRFVDNFSEPASVESGIKFSLDLFHREAVLC